MTTTTITRTTRRTGTSRPVCCVRRQFAAYDPSHGDAGFESCADRSRQRVAGPAGGMGVRRRGPAVDGPRRRRSGNRQEPPGGRARTQRPRPGWSRPRGSVGQPRRRRGAAARADRRSPSRARPAAARPNEIRTWWDRRGRRSVGSFRNSAGASMPAMPRPGRTGSRPGCWRPFWASCTGSGSGSRSCSSSRTSTGRIVRRATCSPSSPGRPGASGCLSSGTYRTDEIHRRPPHPAMARGDGADAAGRPADPATARRQSLDGPRRGHPSPCDLPMSCSARSPVVPRAIPSTSRSSSPRAQRSRDRLPSDLREVVLSRVAGVVGRSRHASRRLLGGRPIGRARPARATSPRPTTKPSKPACARPSLRASSSRQPMARRPSTRSATRCSRKRSTTICCRRSDGATTRPTRMRCGPARPRWSRRGGVSRLARPSCLGLARPSRPPSTPGLRPAERASTPTPSLPPGRASSGHSTCGMRSRSTTGRTGSTRSRCSTSLRTRDCSRAR